MKISLDLAADAGYISISKEPVSRTIEIYSGALLDVDLNGEPVGIELLSLQNIGLLATAPLLQNTKIDFDTLRSLAKYSFRNSNAAVRTLSAPGLVREIDSASPQKTGVLAA